MKELLLHLTRQLVDKPDEVSSDWTEENDTVKVLLKVAEEDKGKIIGKQGKVIRALREVVSAVAAKTNKKVLIDLQ
ncbi:MAG: KH domain-containing protein [Elusimicrobia bacterium]|nr:KH domain-containing protein [Elusimicrobiota bacterium]